MSTSHYAESVIRMIGDVSPRPDIDLLGLICFNKPPTQSQFYMIFDLSCIKKQS